MVRIINLTGGLISYLTSLLVHRAVVYGMPAALNVEISGKCNLRCPECLTGSGQSKRPSGFMEVELYKKILSELKSYLLNVNLYFQGEPMLHPDFFKFVSLSRGIRLTLSTNGHYLTDENISRIIESDIREIIVSLDGYDRQTYSAYRRGGDFEKVREGILKLAAALKEKDSRTKLVVQFLVNRHNEQQIQEVRNFAVGAGARFHLKSMQIINSKGFEEWLPSHEKFRRYFKDDNGDYKLKSRLKNRCLRLWLSPVIAWNGDVLPCCFDKNAEFVLGNIGESSFREIWHGERNRAFREKVLHNRAGIDICRNCTTGLRGVII